MFGYIKKSKVLKIIDKGEEQLRANQEMVIRFKSNELTEDDKLDFRDSIKKFEGGLLALKGLKKHFQ